VSTWSLYKRYQQTIQTLCSKGVPRPIDRIQDMVLGSDVPCSCAHSVCPSECPSPHANWCLHNL
jgi:hypothetical protein